MTTIKGKIEARKMTQEGTGAKGAWQRWVFTIDGKDYSTFDKKIYMFFQVGDYVEMETEKDKTGKYENMVKMEKVAVEAPKPQIDAPVVPSLFQQEKPIVKQEFHQSIEAVRFEACDLAIKFLALRGEKADIDLVFNMANVYKEFLEGKIDGMYTKNNILKGVRPEEKKDETIRN